MVLSFVSGVVTRLGDPNIGKHLLRDEGEVVVDEVTHHWFAYVRPLVETALALALLVGSWFVSVHVAWALIIAAVVLMVRAGWMALGVVRDRFVVTNMRVFRVHGVLSQSLATMPLSRILDISVQKPLHGRLLGFGHFCFESAAQEQGLRDIRYVGRPDDRDLAIQRVVQRAGLRGPRVPN
ncbi:PH domain-containing protein [Nocardioides daeguensis]|uniref:YdbS-like PH domain-containing protein n=1 Tax=Nocardioides daeguensis TaxID=908359 RepID=A0ABP6VJD8_9ACTN|nr:PH domain-containing protein [Nocardioides daeguensis]MBV6727375.1 PH domain-containing protein [Nocardioides daeguensis]MCR1775464.1 PH domain-containing protein [Nocardioides daeguensis]